MLTPLQVCGSPCQFVAKSSLLPLPWYLTQIPSATKTNCNVHKITSCWDRFCQVGGSWSWRCRKKGLSFPAGPWNSHVPTFGFQSQNEHGATEPGGARGEAHWTCLLAKDLVGIDGSSLPWRPWRPWMPWQVSCFTWSNRWPGESSKAPRGPGNGRSSSDFPGLHCQVRHVCLPQNDKNNATQSARLHGCCQASSRSDSSGSWSLPLPSEAPSQSAASWNTKQGLIQGFITLLRPY